MIFELPTEENLFYPIYNILSDMKPHIVKEIIEKMALHFSLNDEQQKRVLDGHLTNGVGIITFNHRIGHILKSLEIAGYSNINSEMGNALNYEIKLNDDGHDFHQKNKHLSSLKFKDEFERLASMQRKKIIEDWNEFKNSLK